MTPGSFDPVTARAVVGDEEARAIEAKARADANAGAYSPPPVSGATYWAKVQAEMRVVVYREQFKKRTDRNQRMKEKTNG